MLLTFKKILLIDQKAFCIHFSFIYQNQLGRRIHLPFHKIHQPLYFSGTEIKMAVPL